MPSEWWVVSSNSQPAEGDRLHTCVEGRYVTVFRHRGNLSCIDSICHHAGGPLTLGKVFDIEDLGLTVVSCPWHKFLVSIDGGVKAYKGVDIINGVPTPSGWKAGKVVQRAHSIKEEGGNVLVKLEVSADGEPCASDQDACSSLCAQEYQLHGEEPTPV